MPAAKLSSRPIRPLFVKKLLSRAMPELRTDPRASLPVYSTEIQQEIKDLKCSDALVSCLHVMNEDYKNATEVLRKNKSSEGKGLGSWLSGYLYSCVGEMLPAKTVYASTPESVLISYFNISPSISPHLQTSHLLDHLSLIQKRSPLEISNDTIAANLVPDQAWTAAELVERGKVREIGHETIENRVGRMRWEEVSKLFLLIEAKEGW